MSNIYRLRPQKNDTIDEIQNHYLWFSKRRGFRDVNDANIGAFVKDTPQIKRGFRHLFGDNEYLLNRFLQLMDNVGICCFTKTFPRCSSLKHFPNGQNSICIEYDKEILVSFFENHIYAMHEPFKNVTYDKRPTKIEGCDNYHILTRKDRDGNLYESIYTLFQNSHTRERLILKLLTTLHSKFHKQNESRIILAGRNLNNVLDSGSGYKVVIPKDAILKIYLYRKPNDTFLQALCSIESLNDKIHYLY